MVEAILTVLVIGVALAGALGTYAWSQCRFHPRISGGFAALMLAAAVWMLGHALELQAVDVGAKLFWANVSYAGIVAVPVAWLGFALQYTGRERLLSPLRLTLLSVEPVIALALAWTRGHRLFRTAIHIEGAGPLRLLRSAHGPAFWVHSAYSYALPLVASALLLRWILTGARMRRRQGLLLLAAGIAPLAANAAYLADLSPWRLDLTPLALVLSGLPLAWAVYRHRLLDIVPVARDAVVEEMGDGVVVLDLAGRVIDLNRAARELLGVGEAEAVGRPMDELFQGAGDVLAAPDSEMEVELPASGGSRIVEARLVPLGRRNGVPSGRLLMLRDVTESRHARAALGESQRWLGLALKGADLGLWDWDLETGAVDYSDRWAEMVGYDHAEIEPHVRSWEALVHPDDLARVRELQQAHVEGGAPSFEAEYRLAAKGGEWRWMICRGRVIARDRLGRPARMAGTQIDVTDLTRAQAELARLQRERARESEEQFRILFDRSPEGILVVDAADQRILKANRACEDLLGCPGGELVGRRLPLVVSEDSISKTAREPQGAEDLLARAAAQGASSGLASVGRPDGSFLRVGFSGTAFPWGATTAVLVTLRDVSERVKAEEARARLEATLRNVASEWVKTFDAIPIGILLVDSDGRVRRLNDAARTMAGRPTFGELPGTALCEMAQGEPWPSAALAAATVTAEGQASLRQAVDESSGRAWAVGASLLARPHPDAPWTIVTVKETTQLVAMQDALRRSESMAALGALVAGVAHEVRSPLFAISTTIELLEGEMDAPGIQRQTIDILREAVGRLNVLMEDLLDYGRPSVQPRVQARLDTVVYTAIRECEQLARSSRVTVASRCPGVMPLVEMDQRGLVRAFQNVIQNAIQHSLPGGAVDVELKTDDNWSVCTVRDSGGGFAREDLRRVFDPFFSRRPGGAGLGLALVGRVVEEHGGQVRARNHPEGGGIVSVRLPGILPPVDPRR